MAHPLVARVALLGALAIVASVAGSARQQDGAPSVREAQISPDGVSVLFTRAETAADSARPARAGLWRIPFAGGDPQPLTTNPSQDSHPRWSPDGRQIAFLSAPLRAKAPARIFVMPADARAARAIVESIDVVGFEWSPSGRRIAFVSGRTTSPGLWVIDANGNGQRRLSEGETSAFAWAPDESAIVRLASAPAGSMRVEIIAADAAAASRAIVADVSPRVSWSRDGIIALLGRPVSGANRVLLAQPDLAIRELPIVATGNLTDVAWIGDGRLSLTFASNAETWIERLTIATGERIAIMPPGIATLTTAPSWSRDGTRYVVVGRGQFHPAEVYAGTVPLPESGRPDTVGARPPPVRRLTFLDGN